MIREIDIEVKIQAVNDIGYYRSLAARQLGIDANDINDVVVLKRSIDARHGNVMYKVRIAVYVGDSKYIPERSVRDYKYVGDSDPVIVVGAGPAGLFAALRLLEKGLKPVIIERGKDVHSRKFDIASLVRESNVNPDSNYCFGEGGAGTFSDGKLFTRSTKRGNVGELLKTFVEHGANPDILVDAHPHIGTDKLPAIMENIRHTIVGHGGEYHFNSRVVDFIVRDGVCKGIIDNKGIGYEGIAVVLATGHSARDVYHLLYEKGQMLEPKGFAMGVRLEHPQEIINDIQYHYQNKQLNLPAASYFIVQQVDGRGVFSFCMCPGGVIVPSCTEQGELVVNGMSNSKRNGRYSNSGLVVQIEPGDLVDYERFGVFSAMEFQRETEHRFFDSKTRTLVAPAQRMVDFANGRLSQKVGNSTYAPGIVSAPVHEMLPDFIADRMRKAFPLFGKKMHGFFTNEAQLVGLESRTSSAVRVTRDPMTYEAVNMKRLFPCGEGAGYSGGIVSSAIDGVNVADAIARIYG